MRTRLAADARTLSRSGSPGKRLEPACPRMSPPGVQGCLTPLIVAHFALFLVLVW
jgi:hypothetical protein